MARRILSQNRGKGTPKTLAKNSRNPIGENPYVDWMLDGFVVNSFKNSGNHTGIFMKVLSLDSKNSTYMIAPEGIKIGDKPQKGELGSVVKVGDLPVNTSVMNIQTRPGTSSRLARCSGTSLKIVKKEENEITLVGKTRSFTFNPSCLCTVGRVSGSGRLDIPFLKAGKKVNCKKKRAYSVSPNKMNAVDHPFGGNSPGCGRHKEIKRTASPGMKVGNIAPRRSGIRKGGKEKRKDDKS